MLILETGKLEQKYRSVWEKIMASCNVSTNVRWEALIRDLEMWFTEMGLKLCKGF